MSSPAPRVLAVKLALAVLGLAVAIVGMAADRPVVVWVAVVLLGGAFLLRFYGPPA
ncbi:MAG: hypothetical protein ACREN5_05640 [Gemmatimonadales bacterium]